jgi:uncharacterized SAM-binding protein YcdF (DUF218 family)
MQDRDPPSSRTAWSLPLRLLSWCLFPAAIVGLAYGYYGRSVAEKVATELVMPIAVICWISLGLAFKNFFRGQRTAAGALFLFSLAIYLGSHPVLSRWLVSSLENKYPPATIAELKPFDTIVVLGGGTSVTPNGQAQLAEAGDRLSLAARLYHQKLASRIVVTGDALRGFPEDARFDPSKQSLQILLESGVPAEVVEELPGTNTSEEIAELKKHEAWWREQRCGLITSAFHMPRTMKLVEKQGIELVPLVADLRQPIRDSGFIDWLPKASAARGIELALREYLGMLVGR